MTSRLRTIASRPACLALVGLLLVGSLAVAWRHRVRESRTQPAELPRWELSDSPPAHGAAPSPSIAVRGSASGPFAWLDLTRLPPDLRRALALLLLVPVGCVLTALGRGIVGLRTFGTATPAFLALSFIYGDWRVGLLVLVPVFGLSLLSRRWIGRLRVMLVPRLSIMNALMVVGVCAAISAAHQCGLAVSAESVLLPAIVLSMIVDRFTIVADEEGPSRALNTLGQTLLVAACCYPLLSWEPLGRLLLAYPELHCFTAAALIAIGSYTGYRLTELWRFRDLLNDRNGNHA